MAIGDDDNNGRSDLRTVSPISSPPPSHDDDDTEPIQISSKTFEKLNELYEMRQFVHSGSDRENYYDLDDVVYRVRQFKDYTTCRNRGSSKTLCSLISVMIYVFSFCLFSNFVPNKTNNQFFSIFHCFSSLFLSFSVTEC